MVLDLLMAALQSTQLQMTLVTPSLHLPALLEEVAGLLHPTLRLLQVLLPLPLARSSNAAGATGEVLLLHLKPLLAQLVV